jgi:N-acyl-L-homoserine lactone synthetase
VSRPLPGAPAYFTALARTSWAEVSRLTIAPRFRSGRAGSAAPTLAAITYASMALAIALDRYVLFSISEPRTPRLLRRLGFEMRQVGEAVDFHGLRAVFRIDVHEVLRAVTSDWQPVVDQLIELAGNSVGGHQGPLARRRSGEGGSYHAA